LIQALPVKFLGEYPDPKLCAIVLCGKSDKKQSQ
jgi:hypothetical protein